MGLLDPTPAELAQKEAALRAEILGGRYPMPGTQHVPYPAPPPASDPPPVFNLPATEPEIFSVDFQTGDIQTSLGGFALNDTERQVLATACVFALKRSFEDTLIKFAKNNGVPDSVIFPDVAAAQALANAQANAALADAQRMAAPTPVPPSPQVSIPVPGTIDEVDPPHPNPIPTRAEVRRGRPRKVAT